MKAPPTLIQNLIKVNPEAALLKLAAGGKTPLHIVCSDLRKTSSGDFWEEDDTVVKLIVSSDPTCVTIADDDGWLPLHTACFSKANLSLLRTLVEAYPQSAVMCNKGGVTPLSLLWNRSALNEGDGRCLLSPLAARFYDRVGGNDRIHDTTSPDSHGSSSKPLYSTFTTPQAYSRRGVTMPRNNSAAVWSKILLMAQAVYYTDFTSSGRTDNIFPVLPLHALSGISCHSSVMEFALRVHGDVDDKKALYTSDEHGNTPLHVAASFAIKKHPTANDSSYSSSHFEHFPRGIVTRLLIDYYPRAANTPNKNGQYPLNLAIKAGSSWEDGIIPLLFDAAPHVLNRLDSKLFIFPFMIASVMSELEISYRLLRCNPGIISSCF